MRQGFGLPWDDPEADIRGDMQRVMRESDPYRTRTGRVVTDDELQQLAAEAEQGYDVGRIKAAGHRVPIGRMCEDTVESESSPGTYYHLKLLADGTWLCDCLGYQYRQECKHSRRKQEESRG